MTTDWVKVYNSEDIYQCEYIRQFLNEHEIPTIILNKRDSMHIHLNNGEIEVLVPRDFVLKARHLLSKHTN